MKWLRKEFTFMRWRYDPFQLMATASLGIWSLLQLTVGVTPGGPFDTQIDHHAQVFVSSSNLLGAIICMTGLHMRDLDSALWVEVIGYISLIGTLVLYVQIVESTTSSWYNSGYGYGLTIAFCAGAIVRTWQIFALKKAQRKARELSDLVARVEDPGQ